MKTNSIQLSRRNLLKGISVGALLLGTGKHITYGKASEMTSIDINGTPIHYVTRGEGTPIILLHGFLLGHEVMLGAYEPIFENRPGYMRIYPDMPGMGLTPATENILTSDDILTVMTEFVNQVIPDQSFLIAGFSYGGYIAQGMVVQNPEAIDGVMLMAPVVSPADANRDLPESMVFEADPDAVALLPPEVAPMILPNVSVQTRPVLERIVNDYLPSFALADMEFLGQLREPENYRLSFDVLNNDLTYDMPSLILTGKHDASVGYAEAFAVSRKYTRATYAALDRAGHGVYLEQDTLYKALVHEWLDRVEEVVQAQ